MATVEGNLEALLDAAEQLVPPVRSGQKANRSQDEVGAPFVTTTIFVNNLYNTDSAAPGWCYGLLLEPSPTGNNSTLVPTIDGLETTFFCSFGSAQAANETILVPGQVFLFPRGARRVFIRSNVADPYRVACSITWVMDRYATITSGGPGSPVATRNWSGDYQSITQTGANGISQLIAGATYVSIGLTNNTNQVVTYKLSFGQNYFDLDTGTLAAGASIMLSYGAGVGNLGNATLGGHGFVMPLQAIFSATCATPGTATGNMTARIRSY